MKLNDALIDKFANKALQVTRRYDALAENPDAMLGDMQAFFDLAYQKSNTDFAYKEAIRAKHIQLKVVVDGMQ